MIFPLPRWVLAPQECQLPRFCQSCNVVALLHGRCTFVVLGVTPDGGGIPLGWFIPKTRHATFVYAGLFLLFQALNKLCNKTIKCRLFITDGCKSCKSALLSLSAMSQLYLYFLRAWLTMRCAVLFFVAVALAVKYLEAYRQVQHSAVSVLLIVCDCLQLRIIAC